jgi:hypothetical protein
MTEDSADGAREHDVGDEPRAPLMLTEGDVQRRAVENEAESVANLNRCEARVHARDTYLPQRTKGLRPESESLVFLVTPMMRSWNQVVEFLTDWEGLRTLVA